MCKLNAGYEAPAQYSEETRNAAKNVPWAIVLSVVATALCGGLHIASLLFSVQVCSAWRQCKTHRLLWHYSGMEQCHPYWENSCIQGKWAFTKLDMWQSVADACMFRVAAIC